MTSSGFRTWLLVAAIGTAITILAFEAATTTSGASVSASLYRQLLICASLTGMSAVSYVAWPSRWNLVGHASLAFCVVGYVIPILSLRVLDRQYSPAVGLYTQAVTLGLVFVVAGTLVGASMVSNSGVESLRRGLSMSVPLAQSVLGRRVVLWSVISILGILVCFAGMGFVPALAANPFDAKFFRGEYAAPYARFAPLYRFSTSLLTVLLPLIAAYAWKRRSTGWGLLLVASLGCMLLGLLRGYAVSGILLTLGVILAIRGGKTLVYFALLVGAYFVGALLYSVLAWAGLSNFATPSGGTSILRQVANGAPDVNDQVNFLKAWLTYKPDLTFGRTFVGGLVPGNYQWNPSVWSLSVLNPGRRIEEISSGGLRLPPPIWGLVSFGWPGVVLVSFGHGLVTGVLAKCASRLVASKDLIASTSWIVLYVAASNVLPNFFRLSYLSVAQLVFVVLLFRYARSRMVEPASAPSELVVNRGPRG